MRPLSSLILAATALGLTACMSAALPALPDDHPASPTAALGGVDTATAIAGYKGADDFAARSLAERQSGAHDGMPHGDMPGMAGMQHGGAPQGAGDR